MVANDETQRGGGISHEEVVVDACVPVPSDRREMKRERDEERRLRRCAMTCSLQGWPSQLVFTWAGVSSVSATERSAAVAREGDGAGRVVA